MRHRLDYDLAGKRMHEEHAAPAFIEWIGRQRRGRPGEPRAAIGDKEPASPLRAGDGHLCVARGMLDDVPQKFAQNQLARIVIGVSRVPAQKRGDLAPKPRCCRDITNVKDPDAVVGEAPFDQKAQPSRAHTGRGVAVLPQVVGPRGAPL